MSVNPSAVSRLLAFALIAGAAPAADHVIVISVDGLRPDGIEEVIDDDRGETFERFQDEGVWTHDARTDHGYTRTMPNNISIVTGRPVAGDLGHEWTRNDDVGRFDTLHKNKDSYVASMFDVAHDHGLRTAVYRSKEKLVIFDNSYDSSDGASDITGADDGRRKIDIERSTDDDDQSGAERANLLVEKFIEDYEVGEDPIHLSYLHIVDPDEVGHGNRWTWPIYHDAIADVNTYIGDIIVALESNPVYAGNTTIILTTDHGGTGSSHSDEGKSLNYTIPFYVWGADVGGNGDLYTLNSSTRVQPSGRPAFALTNQPIRNGDAANLALDLLDLPAIPGSSINSFQDLAVGSPAPPPPPPVTVDSEDVILSFDSLGQVVLSWDSGADATVQISATGAADDWVNAPLPGPRSWPINTGTWTDFSYRNGRHFYRVRFD